MIDTTKLQEIDLLGIQLLPVEDHAGIQVFAQDLATSIGIDPDSGSVVAVDKEMPKKRILMNTSFDRYLQMQDAILDYAERVREMDDDQADAFVQEKKAAFTEIDPEAMTAIGSWWSIIIEQMEVGHI